MQEKSADCSKNGTFLVESQKSKVESKESRELEGERKKKGRKKEGKTACCHVVFFVIYANI